MLRIPLKSLLLILSISSAGLAYSAVHQDREFTTIPPPEFLSGINFASPQHYLDYLMLRQREINGFASEKEVTLDLSLPATLIVGNGRGAHLNDLPTGLGRQSYRIDVTNYGRNAYFYLLMDLPPDPALAVRARQIADAYPDISPFSPDLCCDVLQLQEFAIEHDMLGKFDAVVFEMFRSMHRLLPKQLSEH